MPGLSATGLDIPTLEELKNEIESYLRANVSPTLDLSTSSPLGQIVAIAARTRRISWEVIAAIYASMDPDGASGVTLENLCAITGTTRRGATFSQVSCTADLDAGTYAAGSLIAHVVGRPDDRFSNVDEIVSLGGSQSVVFRAETAGAIAAAAGTLTEISGAVAGWNSITNGSNATIGLDIETDGQLRVRREVEIQASGSTTVDAILADISQNLTGIISVSVLENDTDAVDGNGLDPHSFEVIAYGPQTPATEDNEALAEQIFLSKPGGIGTYGSTTIVVVDSQGYEHAISFTRPAVLTAEIEVTVEYFGDEYTGDAELAAYLVEQGDSLGVGDTLDWSEIVNWAMDFPGVTRVTSVSVGNIGAPLLLGSLTPTIRELVRLSVPYTSITSSEGAP